MSVLDLVRPEIRTMRPYRSAQFTAGFVRLNANENPWRPPGDSTAAGLNWYPEPRPLALGAALAAHYGVDAAQVLVTRGSSEAIDVLIRAFCRAGRDEILICPPTFGMYETYAQIQGAGIRQVPLRRDAGYSLDTDGILARWQDATRLVFICSPNNPTGNSVPLAEIRRLALALRGRGVVVVDAAYAEFAADDQSLSLLREFDNVVVLRTLSKAMALAGVRCGALLARAELADLLSCVLPPYTFPTLCAEAVTACLDPASAGEWQQRIREIKVERTRLLTALAKLRLVRRAWPSDANFILIEATDAQAVVAAARGGGVLVRDFSWDPALPDCIRITIGTPAQNDQLLAALG